MIIIKSHDEIFDSLIGKTDIHKCTEI